MLVRSRLVALVVLLVLRGTTALAAPGDLDPTFGDGGRVALPLPPSAWSYDVLVQPDGKLVVAGSTSLTGVVTRLLADGAPDPSFGTAGVVTLTDQIPMALALGSDGEIVVAGLDVGITPAIFTLRLSSAGAPDPTYGTLGATSTRLYYFLPNDEIVPMESGICGLAVLAGGAVIVGLSPQVEHPLAFLNGLAAIRFGSDGVLDAGFGNHPSIGVSLDGPGGVGVADPTSAFNFCRAMAVDAAGGIVLGGQHIGGTTPQTLRFEPVLARLASDGTPDASFGGGGVAHVPGFTSPGINATVVDLVVDALGRIAVAGNEPGPDGFDLVRFDAAGLPDPSFGSGGIASLPGSSTAAELTTDAHGRLLVAGRHRDGLVDHPFAVMRVLDDGSLDPTFAGGAPASTTFAGAAATAANGIATDAAGNVVVAGVLAAEANQGQGLALARFVGRMAAGTPLAGRTLKLEASDEPARRRLVVLSVDSAIALGEGAGSGDDPRLAGATIRVHSDAGFDATYGLPPAGWMPITSKGEVVGWRYRAEAGPIRRVIVQRGRRLRIVGRGDGLEHTLATNPDPVGVTFTLGGHPVCLAFGGAVQVKDTRSLRARNAPAPASCD